MRRGRLFVVRAAMVGMVLGGAAALDAADAPSPKLALTFKPSQKDVEYEIPDPADVERCEVKVERRGKVSGWVVIGPAGQVLRRFVDTNADNVVDQWRYYNHGIEVYRDIDSDFNNKVDQCRWLNTAGSRWGIDSNEDGRIDRWKVLSAEEASREAVRALIHRDERALQAVLINEDDLQTLGIKGDLAAALLEAVDSPGAKMRDVLSNSSLITAETQWLRFDSAPPGTIPVDEGKAKGDLLVYENAMAIVESGGRAGLIQIGEMIRVGDVWKLTRIPQPIDDNAAQVVVESLLIRPALPGGGAAGAPAGAISADMQRRLEELQELDKNSPPPSASPEVLGRYNARRADLLAKIVELSKSEEERSQWMRQMIDGIAASIQTGGYPDGLARLKSVEEELRESSPRSPLVPYASFRRLLSEYTTEIQNPEADDERRQEIQQWWLKELEEFVDAHPRAEDAPEALLQLAVNHEFTGNLPEARKWYGQLAESYGDTNAGGRAAGAVRRLELEGKPLALSGAGLNGGEVDAARHRGKVLLVVFWATWCKPCTEDLPQLRALYQEHRGDGFEILGVNLDTNRDLIQPYLSQHRVPWPQIHEPGGLESEPARRFGIISLPTMFLVGADGAVVSRSATVAELKEELPALLKK